MSFGRWLLVHSFSIFLVGLLLFGYLYREELQLEQAYHQLLNLDDSQQVISALQRKTVQPSVEEPNASTEAAEAGKSDTNEVAAPVEVTTEQPNRVSMAPVVATEPTISETVQSPGQQLLMSARRAFWNRDYQASVERYRELLNRQPTNADYNGELGNVYYAMNDFDNASQQYYRTALILLDGNQIEAARQLLPPVTALNRALGDRLQSRFQRKY